MLNIYQRTRYQKRMSWISPTDLRHSIMNDPIVDVFELTKQDQKDKMEDFDLFLIQKGKQFEKDVVHYIHTHYCPVITLDETFMNENIKETISLIKNKTYPILHNVPFKNTDDFTYGIIDLLVRNDVFQKIFPNIQIETRKQKFYVVIDIKFSTLYLSSDGESLLNQKNQTFYKSQCFLYNQAIGKIQEYTPKSSYILGRRYSFRKKGKKTKITNCFDHLGTISFQHTKDNYEQQIKNIQKWIKTIKQKRFNLSILHPNMKNSTPEWNSLKRNHAIQQEDITQLWNCNPKNRDNAHSHNIYKLSDKKLSSSILGINGSKARVIDSMLNINRQSRHLMLPRKIKSDYGQWRQLDESVAFCDFETINDLFDPLSLNRVPIHKSYEIIFMIGLYYYDHTTQNWEYKSFCMDEISFENEKKICKEFTLFMSSQKINTVWYWHAEQSQIHRLIKRHPSLTRRFMKQSWYDLCYLFKSEPIVIKGVYDFSLKSIAKKIQEYGMINARIVSECDSGMNAMMKAYDAYTLNDIVMKHKIIDDIKQYNKFDVESLYEILYYIIHNH